MFRLAECRVRPEARYMLMRIGTVEFAYTAAGGFLCAVGKAWAAGFRPDTLPSALGKDLPSVAANLCGVDAEPFWPGLADRDPGRTLH